METNRLRQLCTVIETGAFREAARLLHISHGGLSKSIKALEDELGAPLFAPSGRGVVATDLGRRVYEAARRVLAEVDALETIAKAPDRQAEGPLRIATFEVFSTYFMGELVERAFAKRRLYTREAVPGEIEQALADEIVDIGITHVPVPRVEVDYLRVTTMSMAVYARPNRFDATRFEEWPFAAPAISVRGAAPVRGLDGWPDETVPRRIAYAVDMMETALVLARRGRAVVFLPTFVADLHNREARKEHALELLPLPKGVASACEREVFIAKRKSTEETRDIKRIAKVLREIVRPK